MSHARRHALTLEPRGAEHLHPYLPSCSCGWSGIPGRRKWARDQYRLHVTVAEAAVRRGDLGGPMPVTPADQLPEALR